jgi:putative ABC transport system permease protein
MTQHPSGEPRWRRYLRFFRGSVESDIDDELRFHFDERIAELIAQGLTPEAARARAVEEFGDVTDVRRDLSTIDHRLDRRRDRLAWLRDLAQDARYSARSLGRTPIVAITIVLTLALGLGVNVAVFSLIDVLFLRMPPGVADARGVQRVWKQVSFTSGTQYWPGFDHRMYRALRDAVQGDATTATYAHPVKSALRGADDGSFAQVSYAEPEFFSMLGVRAARGRLYGHDEDRLGSPAMVAVVSDAFWRRQLGAADNAIGRSLRIVTTTAQEFTIVGITPPGFSGVEISATDVWLPLATTSRSGGWWDNPNVNGFQILVRPRPGVFTVPLADRLTRASQQPELAWTPEITVRGIALSSLVRARGPGESEQEVQLAARLGGVALLVLLIAIANVVNLLLARALRRRREIAVRLALGISRARLVRLLVTESVLLAVLAAVASLAAAWWGGLLLRAILLPNVVWAETPLHWRVLAFGVAAAVTAGLVAGLIPATQSTAPDLTDSLKAGSREGTTSHRSRLRSGLVVIQAALSLILLVGAALFLQSLANVRAVDIGFDQNRLTFASVQFDTRDTARDSRVARELVELAARLRRRPGVEQVALTHIRPLYGFSWRTYFPEADTVANKPGSTTYVAVSPEYFEVSGLRFLRGAGFPADGSPTQTVVINEAMAERLWPRENPIGRCLRFLKPDAPCYRITGVVETASRDNVIEQAQAQYYVPLHSMPFPGTRPGVLIVRSSATARAAVAGEIQSATRAAFPSGHPSVLSMTDALEPEYRPWKLGATLFTLLGVLALVVAVIGIYSTMSYAVSQRVHEFGVRIALGARAGDVMRHVLAGALRVVGLGVIVGLAAALAGGRLVASLLYGVRPADPIILAAVAGLLLAVAAIAALVPAWRAARVNPVTALQTA